jgi:hypothetical protein
VKRIRTSCCRFDREQSGCGQEGVNADLGLLQPYFGAVKAGGSFRASKLLSAKTLLQLEEIWNAQIVAGERVSVFRLS